MKIIIKLDIYIIIIDIIFTFLFIFFYFDILFGWVYLVKYCLYEN